VIAIGLVSYFCLVARFPLLHFFRYSFLVLLILPINSLAQYYSIGVDPSSIKWHQTKVENFNLIYPEKESILAAKFSRALNDLIVPVNASMGAELRGLPIIMHPYTSFSNGSSILAPRRIELFPNNLLRWKQVTLFPNYLSMK
jgi:hypothetical protein